MGSCVVRPGPAIGAVIELEGISKRYWQIKERSLIRALIPLGGPNRSELWALRDVELRVREGETLGIIGHNGAGKSTLLRLLAGVSQPTAGRLAIRGRIAPLLSVGVGFHPEMTGRENVFVNGMLLGLTRTEIKSRFDEIVEFTGPSDFIDTPVKFYSSGMFMRLGFSVAAAGPVASRSTLPTSSRRSFPRTSTGPPSTFHPARRGRSGRDGGGHQRRRGAADQLRVGPLRERVHRRGATGEGWRTSLIGGVCPVRTQASRRASRGWPSRGRLLVAAG